MKIGKLEIRSFSRMYWDGMQLRNPLIMLYCTLMLPLYLACLFVFCVVKGITTLEFGDARRTFYENLLF